MVYKIKYFYIGYKFYIKFYISGFYIKKQGFYICFLLVFRDYNDYFFINRNYIFFNEVNVLLNRFLFYYFEFFSGFFD